MRLDPPGIELAITDMLPDPEPATT